MPKLNRAQRLEMIRERAELRSDLVEDETGGDPESPEVRVDTPEPELIRAHLQDATSSAFVERSSSPLAAVLGQRGRW